MIRFEDLMAARFLYQQLPERRDVLMAVLEQLKNDPGQRTLLSCMVDGRMLTREQASWVYTRVEAHKRERAVAIYGHILTQSGVPAAALTQLLQQLGDTDMNVMGDVVRARKLLPPEREQQLRFQARLAFDRDMANQVQAHLMTNQVAARLPTAPGQSGPLPHLNVLGSGVIKAPLPKSTAHEEAARIVQGTLSDADGELPGPAFRIPDRVDMSDPRTGKMLGPYRILGRIGAGAMGTVYLCDSQSDPKKPIALKLLPRDAGSDAQGRFKREILANSFFSHPGALDVYDAGQTETGYHYLAMEFFDGDDLSKVLEEMKKLPPRTALTLSRQVFETLGAAHDCGVIHRDVKPSNVLVDAEYQHARLMDFGIAIIKDIDGFERKIFHTVEGGVSGTPEYMSPEQAAGETLTPMSDLYSMGVVLYHTLAGRLPFHSETSGGFITCHMIEDPLPLTKADPSLRAQPREMLDLVDRLLAKDPAKRPDLPTILKTIDEVLPKVTDRGGSSRLLSFLGWRRA
ncbi:MAG: serine/threonine-protein kinase [Planctomycetota bacterium]